MPKTFSPTNFPPILRRIKSTRGVSSYEIGMSKVISRENISAIENYRTNPSLHTFIKILDFLDCEIVIVDKLTKQEISKLELIEKEDKKKRE